MRYPVFARSPLACLLVALGAAGCMQSPQAAARASAPQGLAAQADCRGSSETEQWREMEQDLQAQGLALRVECAGGRLEGAVQLVVVDSVRASEVLRGPLADGESVELGLGANASPDVRFNSLWLNRALLRHRVQMADGEGTRPTLQPLELAAR